MAKKVLIIDDVATDRAAVCGIVRKLGFETIEAANGAEGVAMAKAHKPAAILMDVVMPEMSGFEATRALLEDAATRSIPVVIVSSRSQISDFHRASSIGARGYLTKPIDAQAVVDTLTPLI